MVDCIFCKIAKGEIFGKKIYENDNFVSFLDAYPVTKGHSLVVSKKHFKTFLDLPDNFGGELLDCIKKTALKVMKENDCSGFNVINNNFEIAGQVVKHVHFHVIPRKKDNGVKTLA